MYCEYNTILMKFSSLSHWKHSIIPAIKQTWHIEKSTIFHGNVPIKNLHTDHDQSSLAKRHVRISLYTLFYNTDRTFYGLIQFRSMFPLPTFCLPIKSYQWGASQKVCERRELVNWRPSDHQLDTTTGTTSSIHTIFPTVVYIMCYLGIVYHVCQNR